MFSRIKGLIAAIILVLLLATPALSSTRALQFEVLRNGILHPTTGSPVSAGTVNFYAAGTTTAKNAWTAKDKTGAITSATLDTAGQYQAYGDGEYKLVIKDSAGTTLYTWDNLRIQYPNYALVSKAATYEVAPDDDFVLVDTSSGNITITLETAANFTHPVTIKNIGANNAVLDPDGTETIDGDSTHTLSSQYESTRLVSDGSNWSKTIDFPTATTTTAGKIEIATDAETVTGTDTARATTAANITAKMAAPGAIGGTTPATGAFTTIKAGNYANKNLLINGGMTHAQRGASGSASFTDGTNTTNSDDTWILDRWLLLSDGNNIVDITQQTGGGVNGKEGYVRLDIETAAKKFAWCQIIENKNLKSILGGTASVSAEIQVSNATRLSDIRMVVLSWDSTADSVTSDWVSAWAAEGTVPTPAANWTAENVAADLGVTTSWVKYEIENVSIDTTNAANVCVCVYQNNVATASGTGDFLEITNFQLEKGAVATDFEYRDVGYELLLSQRYFCKSYDQVVVPATADGDGKIRLKINAVANSDHAVEIYARFPVDMRNVPTITSYDMAGASGKLTMVAGNNIAATVTAAGTGGFYNSGTNGVASTDRTLHFHYTAESEL